MLPELPQAHLLAIEFSYGSKGQRWTVFIIVCQTHLWHESRYEYPFESLVIFSISFVQPGLEFDFPTPGSKWILERLNLWLLKCWSQLFHVFWSNSFCRPEAQYCTEFWQYSFGRHIPTAVMFIMLTASCWCLLCTMLPGNVKNCFIFQRNSMHCSLTTNVQTGNEKACFHCKYDI